MRGTASYYRIIGFAILAFFLSVGLSRANGKLKTFEPYRGVVRFHLLFHIVAEVCVAALQGVLFKTLTPERQELI
jgi:hypothetical protein